MTNTHFKTTLAAGLLGAGLLSLGAGAALAGNNAPAPLTPEAVQAAQAAWGEALVAISTAYAQGGIEAARPVAEAALDTAYGYQLGPVLFKPTLTVAPQTFRSTREGALAYFIGQNPEFPNDSGFALGGWTSVEIENHAIFIHDDIAKTMGNVHLTNAAGDRVTVDKTWGFLRDAAGDLRIVLHHSSLPFVAE